LVSILPQKRLSTAFSKTKKTRNLTKPASFFAILLLVLAFYASISNASTINFDSVSFSPQITCSMFTGNGTLFAGDNNYTLYRSDDNGATFTIAYRFTNQTNSTGGFTGYFMMLFIDSKNNIFVSIPGTNRLYRSGSFGLNFTEVLRTNSTIYDGYYVAMSEDSSGNLYTTTYSNNDSDYPQTFKSADGGVTWKTIILCSVPHMHNVIVNPNNGYLYVVSGEYGEGNLHGNADSERIFRSIDGGATWKIIIERNMTSPKIYAVLQFDGNWTYIASDMANATNFIDRFYDDGIIGKTLNGTGTTAVVQRVYTSPANDGTLPFISTCWFNNSMIFSTSVEFTNGTARIILSKDGLTWNTIKSVNYTSLQHHCNMLTSNPKDRLFGSDGPNANFVIINQPDPVPTPTPSPSPSPTSTPSPSPTPTPTPEEPSPTATPTPTPTSAPSPIPNPTTTPTPTPAAPTTTTTTPTITTIRPSPKPSSTASPKPSAEPTAEPATSPTLNMFNPMLRLGFFSIDLLSLAVMVIITLVMIAASTTFMKRRQINQQMKT
jgi:hypothetical protein